MSTGSALVITFADLDPVVGPYRLRHDASAPLGVPAHVTVHYPWRPADTVDPATLDEVGAIAATQAPFAVTFATPRWFGTAVLYLAPEPETPFRELAQRSADRFPDYPLYSGEFADVVPHLTVGEVRAEGDHAALRAAEAELVGGLPLRSRAEAITWLRFSPAGRWEPAARIALGTGDRVNLS